MNFQYRFVDNMIKTIPPYQLPERKNNFKIMVDKLRIPECEKQPGLELWLKNSAYSEKIGNEFIKNPKRWDKFHSKYKNEFEKKIKLMEEIRQNKIENSPLIWIDKTKLEYNKAVV